MTSPKAYLRTSYKDKDGSSAVYVLMNIEKRKLWFNTGAVANEGNWLKETGRIRGASKKVKDDNR